MEMILLDWTRMGRSYCLAGVVAETGGLRTVRSLLAVFRDAPVGNVGWSPFLIDGHQALGGLRAGRSRGRSGPAAAPGRRLGALAAAAAALGASGTAAARPGECIFGTPLITTRASAYPRSEPRQR
jgi:hypothetical protein